MSKLIGKTIKLKNFYFLFFVLELMQRRSHSYEPGNILIDGGNIPLVDLYPTIIIDESGTTI